MKTALAIFVALCISPNWTNAQTTGQTAPSDTPYAVVSTGANEQVWQATTYETLPSGQTVPHVHQYTEMATGLHFWSNGQWMDSKEKINILPDGTAAATNGQHQAYFPGDIYQGEIQLVTPDGKLLQNQPIGLSYDDGSNTVLIAELTNSIGYLVGSNQVLYSDAFTGLKADLLYTYTKGGFEQDIILRESPLTPESYGLNPATARLQVLTEFFDTNEPVQTPMPVKSQDGLSDTTLTFGQMKMIPGKAFSIGNSSLGTTPIQRVPVYKSWLQLDGRTFLVEELAYQRIEPQLEQLPVPANAGTAGNSPNSVRHKISAIRLLPPPRLAQASTKAIQLAKAESNQRQGVVLDYVTIISSTNDFTLQGDTTYRVSGTFNVGGTLVIEGGAVVKYPTNSSSEIYLSDGGNLICKTDRYRPAIFTSVGDNSVGESIGSGNPYRTIYYGEALYLDDGYDKTLSNLRFSYMNTAVEDGEGNIYTVKDVQFDNCTYAFNGADNSTLILNNDLFYNVGEIVGPGVEAWDVYGNNVTVHNCSEFLDDWDSSSVFLTNCLFVAVTNLSIDESVPYTTNAVVIFTNDPGIFQVVGAGGHYLAPGSPYRNAGTTNMDPNVLADIATKTTYPPIVYNIGGSFSTSLNLFPQAQRDSDVPDLGYHYDPLDYMFGSVYVTNATITVNPGTAIAVYGTNSGTYGFGLAANAQLLCQGSPNNLARIVEYNTVQEQVPAGWNTTSYGLVAIAWGGNPTINCRFTDWSVMAQDTAHIRVAGLANPINLQDSQFHGGKLITSYPTINLTNCLLERVNADLEPEDDNVPVIRNSLIWGGTFGFGPWQTNSVVQDNLFDHAAIPDWLAGYGTSYVGGHNAFVTNCDTLDPTFTGDVILTNSPAYQSSWLGNYYLPTNSPLINAGSTNANLVGLYHYTVTTNQVVEGTNIVSIGYHYVAVDTNGIPISTPVDGIPDYLADANGNGVVDSGEISWTNYTSLNGLTFANGLLVFTPLK